MFTSVYEFVSYMLLHTDKLSYGYTLVHAATCYIAFFLILVKNERTAGFRKAFGKFAIDLWLTCVLLGIFGFFVYSWASLVLWPAFMWFALFHLLQSRLIPGGYLYEKSLELRNDRKRRQEQNKWSDRNARKHLKRSLKEVYAIGVVGDQWAEALKHLKRSEYYLEQILFLRRWIRQAMVDLNKEIPKATDDQRHAMEQNLVAMERKFAAVDFLLRRLVEYVDHHVEHEFRNAALDCSKVTTAVNDVVGVFENEIAGELDRLMTPTIRSQFAEQWKGAHPDDPAADPYLLAAEAEVDEVGAVGGALQRIREKALQKAGTKVQ